MIEAEIFNLPKIADSRGNLSIIEQIKQIPFVIKRVHWVYDVPEGMTGEAMLTLRLRNSLLLFRVALM